MKWYITNEARSAELVMIISYPASPSRICVLLKTLRHIIENLKKKSERKERSFWENWNQKQKHCFQKLHVDLQAEDSVF